VRVEWKTAEATKNWVEQYIYGTKDHFEMIELAAKEEGMNVLDYVKQLEQFGTSAAYYGIGTWGTGAERDWKYEEVAKRAL
jgi:hypothetical protein